ncbi:MAG: metal-dependent hydrolase [Chloroflexi bacterium]|nr:MAG: metal-dependent hydrolase [Chloroflexota bacterium]
MTTIQFLGHSAFTLAADDKLVAVDPFLSGNPKATMSADDLNPTAILVTHGHADHIGDTVSIARRTGAPVFGIVELAGYLGGQGIEATGFNLGGTASFDGGSVKLVPAWHSSCPGDGQYVGTQAGMVVRFGGKTVYFAGDTCLFLDMQLIGDEELDIAVLPIGDFYTMGPKDAVRAVKFLRPKFVIPCHYNTFPPIEQDAAEFKKQVEEQTSTKCVVLQPGESWEIS